MCNSCRVGHSIAFDEVLATEEDRLDVASFDGEAEVVAALLERDGGEQEQAFLAALRCFSDRRLPCRGWFRLLELGAGAGSRAILLAGRGYAVTVVERDATALRFVRHRIERRGLEANAVVCDRLDAVSGPPYDAAVCLDPAGFASDAVEAARLLRPKLRKRGLLLGGPAFAGAIAHRRRELERIGFSVATDFGADFPSLRVRGYVGRVLAQFPSR
jgi:SAM-dependent methyltransferase